MPPCAAFPILQALREAESDESIPARTSRAAVDLADIIDELHNQVNSIPVAELVEKLLERIAYREYVERSDEKESRNRIEVVNEFIVACKQYDERQDGQGLAGFLEETGAVVGCGQLG